MKRLMPPYLHLLLRETTMNKIFAVLVMLCVSSLATGSDSESSWYNYKSKKTEQLANPPLDRLEEFLPQTPPALGLYKTYQTKGMPPLEAYVQVLKDIEAANDTDQ